MALARPTPPRDAYARYSVLEYLLIGDLRDLLEEPADSETRRWLLAVVEELLDLLPNEFEFEDHGAISPTFASRIRIGRTSSNGCIASTKACTSVCSNCGTASATSSPSISSRTK